ncbi:DUF2846 domain-containing protein [Pelobacter propionicus]|nr:DUF2846 domain-containing protein [Pelobacter propionicus]
MKKLIAGMALLVLAMAGCATVPPPRPEFTRLPQLEKGWGRIFVSAGHFKSVFSNIPLKETANTGPVFVNGQNIGSTAFKEYIVADIMPGRYEAYWVPTAPEKFYSEKTMIDIQVGQVRYFSCDISTMGEGGSLGLIGVLASDYLWRGWLAERPLDNEGKLVSYFKINKVSVAQ